MAQRGVTKHSSMKEWLKSKAPGAGGGGGKFLGWKKDGQVDTFLHTKCLPMAVWRHPFATLVPIEKDGQKTVHVWTKKYTCHETEDVLESMYFREEKGNPESARKKPPERCGVCKFVEWLWLQCWAWIRTHKFVNDKDGEGKKLATGKWVVRKGMKPEGVDPCARLFRFTSEADDKENTTIHVGGYCGLFGKKDLPDDLQRAMKAAKIRPSEAWKESSVVKPESVLCVVNADKPADGVQISVETKELGEKVKEEITRVWKSQEIDIQKTPYCIRWEYDSEAQMGKMYKATAMMKVKPSPRILKLVRGPAPDLSALEEPFNQQTMRSVLERHCLLEKGIVPWDSLFPTREQEKKWREEDEAANDEEEESTDDVEDADDEDVDDDADDEDADDEDADDDSDDDDEDDEDDDEDEDDDLVECDGCSKPMKITDKKCPHCGKDYSIEDEEKEPPKPETKKLKSRAEVLAEKKKKASAGKKDVKKAKEPEPEEDEDDDADEDDEDDDVSDADETAAGDGGDDTNQDDEIPF